MATTLTFLHYQKIMLKKEVKQRIIAGIEKKELVLLKFTKLESKTKIHWENSKEFEYNGEMYDIVETKIVGGIIYYWCWLDYEETGLNKKIDDVVYFVLRHDKQRKENEKRVEKFFNSLFFCSLPNWNNFVVPSSQTIITHKYSYKSISYPPPVPPPKNKLYQC